MSRRFPLLLVAMVVVVGLVAVLGYRLFAGPAAKHLSADFANTINLYPGAQVKVLGVGVGQVDSVVVRGTSVRVELSYRGSTTLPADVHAAIVPPSIVGDRFIQLTPPYTGGPALADGAHLNTDHTQVPVELDDTYRGLNDLATALGPDGANSRGALSEFITQSAANLGGNGAALRGTIRELSGALDTLGGAREDIAGTVTNLGSITGTLAGDDKQVRALLDNLAAVSSQLNGQRDELRGAGENLNHALADIAGFVRDNRGELTDNIAGLQTVSATLAEHQKDLASLLDTVPLGLSNLLGLAFPVNYDPVHPGSVAPLARTTAVAARPGGLIQNLPKQLAYSVTALCGALPAGQQQQLAGVCGTVQRAGGDLGELLLRSANPALGPGLGSGPLLGGGGR